MFLDFFVPWRAVIWSWKEKKYILLINYEKTDEVSSRYSRTRRGGVVEVAQTTRRLLVQRRVRDVTTVYKKK